MKLTRRVALLFKALHELGPRQVAQFGWYRLQLKSGWMKLATGAPHETASPPAFFIPLPAKDEVCESLGAEGQALLLQEADELISGRVRLFGGEPVPLQLAPPGDSDSLPHWTDYENRRAQGTWEDIKFVWEPARFGWACTLGRAYFVSHDARYAEAFWQAFELFRNANPPYRGPNWISAQEAALRILSFTIAYHLFAGSPASTAARMAAMGQALAEHARRILPSLSYARAQHNNHLLSEAAGLYTSGLALPNHRQAKSWRKLGWRWFSFGLRTQIEADGTYTQHSLNYHRLMLQLALWMDCLRQVAQDDWTAETRKLLQAAVQWLAALVDPHSGRAPNLGANDGAYILPLTVQPFSDLRPVLRAASCAFGRPAGPETVEHSAQQCAKDEMALWLACSRLGKGALPAQISRPEKQRLHLENSGLVLPHPTLDSWVYLRAARFRGRPSHADQLHFDLWWRGLNLALDAGTYLYNGAPPWDNALVSTHVHNTISVDRRNQMRPVGRFLWLDKVQAQVLVNGDTEYATRMATAVHDGYRHRGVRHERSVEPTASGWRVEDRLLLNEAFPRHRPAKVRLHWLLPDLPWKAAESETGVIVQVETERGYVQLTIGAGEGCPQPEPGWCEAFSLARAGELLWGSSKVPPTRGWWAPTYGHLQPALSIAIELLVTLPYCLISEWRLEARAD